LSIFFLVVDFKMGFILFNLSTLPILIVAMLLKFKKIPHALMTLMIVASIFSFAGDGMMLLDIEESLFKTIGICTFIVAQTCYGLLYYFSTQYTGQSIKPPLFKRWPEFIAIVILVIYASFILEYTNEFFLPSLLYSIFGISTFVLAINRRFFVSRRSFILVFVGAFLFILSASLTGFDLFATNKIRYAVSIIFYTTGHYLCSLGILTQIEEIIDSEVPVNSSFEK
jgi:hypothetical protein